MHIEPFATEQYFSLYEFTAPHLLSASDCETISVGELCSISGTDLSELAALNLHYTESQGHPKLRQQIATQYAEIDASDIVVLTAPEEGIYLTMRTLLEPGDRVIVLSPCYDSLANVAAHIGCDLKRWELRPTAQGWKLDLEQLAALATDETKLIIVNFPHNPTGFLPTCDEYGDIIAQARRTGCWLLSDEMYRGLEYDKSAQLPSGATQYDQCLVLSGLSKVHGLPGLRSGWLVVRDHEVRKQLINWKHYTSICPPAPSEFLATAALSVSDQLAQRNVSLIKDNLKTAESFFRRHQSRFVWRPPRAGSVALVEMPGVETDAYCHELARDHGVVLLPGTCLGAGNRFVRFGFGRRSFKKAIEHYEQLVA